MKLCMLFLLITGHFFVIEAACSQPTKFYVDCGQTRTISTATQFCLAHHMSLVNLTNGTGSLTNDIAVLNNTFVAKNCVGNFWFSSGSRTGLIASVADLDNLLGGLLGGVLNLVLCLIPFICPAATTAAPITIAYTVCTRPVQQHVIQKCTTQVQRTDMKQFKFNDQSMTAGILDTFASRSQMSCSGACSSDTDCVGISYNNGICNLYM